MEDLLDKDGKRERRLRMEDLLDNYGGRWK
jgi:hypothetical protein